LGVAAICAMTPIAMISVPAALICGGILTANDMQVCGKYKELLDSPDFEDESQPPPQQLTQQFCNALPEYVPSSCGDCGHFSSYRDSRYPTAGRCVKWDSPASTDEVCDDWQQLTVTVPHKTILPAPTPVEPTPIAAPAATPPAAKPVAVSPSLVNRADFDRAVEEVAIARNLKPRSVDAPLSELAAAIDFQLRALADGEALTVKVDGVLEAFKRGGVDIDDTEIKTAFKELNTKRSNNYELNRFTMELTVQEVA
jgi:hypothetical protein